MLGTRNHRMTNTAAVLLATARASMHSTRPEEREHAAKYEAGIRRLIAETEGIEISSTPHPAAPPSPAQPTAILLNPSAATT